MAAATTEERKHLNGDRSLSLSGSDVFSNDPHYDVDGDGHNLNIDTTILDAQPLTQKRIEELAKTPKWRAIRIAILCLFWGVWLAMLALTVYFIVNARDAVAEELTKASLEETYLVVGKGWDENLVADSRGWAELKVAVDGADEDAAAKLANGYLQGEYFTQLQVPTVDLNNNDKQAKNEQVVKTFLNAKSNQKLASDPTARCDGQFWHLVSTFKPPQSHLTEAGYDNPILAISSLLQIPLGLNSKKYEDDANFNKKPIHLIESDGPLIEIFKNKTDGKNYIYSNFIVEKTIEFKTKILTSKKRLDSVKCQVFEIEDCKQAQADGQTQQDNKICQSEIRIIDGLADWLPSKRVIFSSWKEELSLEIDY